MLSVIGWSSMLRDAEEHLAEVEALIAALRPLAEAEAPAAGHGGPRAGAGRPPGRAAAGGKATGQPAGKPPGRPPGTAGAGPAAIHAAGRIAGLGSAEAIRAVLAAGGPATSRQIYERLTAAGWHRRLSDKTRRHQVDVAASSMLKRGAVRSVGQRAGGAGNGPRAANVFALAEAPPAAVAKLAAAAARLGADASAKSRKAKAAPAKAKAAPAKAYKPRTKRAAHYGRPRLTPDIPLNDRIARVLGAKPNRTAPEILAALNADGWQTRSGNPLNVIRQGLAVMAKRKAIVINRTATPYYYKLSAAARVANDKAAANRRRVNGAEANNAPAIPPSAPAAGEPSTTTEH